MTEGAPIESDVLEERLPPQRRAGALLHTAWATDSTSTSTSSRVRAALDATAGLEPQQITDM